MPNIVHPVGDYPNAALTFAATATSDRANAPCNNLDNLTQFSLLLLVRPTTLTSGKVMFAKYRVDEGWTVQISGTSGNVSCYQARATAFQSYVTNTTPLAANKWTWLGFLRDQSAAAGSLWKIWSMDVNSGVWKPATMGTATDGSGVYDNDSTPDASIGNAMKSSPIDAFPGQIAFAGIYREVLQVQELATMVRTGDFQKARALGIWYPGSRGATIVPDVTGLGNTMTVTGATMSAAPLQLVSRRLIIPFTVSAPPSTGEPTHYYAMQRRA